MNLQQRISAFVSLGQYLYAASQQSDTDAEIDLLQLFNRAKFKNPWYSTDNIKLAFVNCSQLLTEENLSAAVQNFSCPENMGKRVAAVLTDRIPLECFPDIVCILLTGNHAIVRPTEKDFVTWFVLKKLKEIEPEFASFIEIDDAILHPFDAIIADPKPTTTIPITRAETRSFLESAIAPLTIASPPAIRKASPVMKSSPSFMRQSSSYLFTQPSTTASELSQNSALVIS